MIPIKRTPPSAVRATATLYKEDPNWYSDTGALNHLTNDLDHLEVHERDNGGDQVQVGNEACLRILHTGHSLIHTTT
jgi:hypothetical protein